MVTKYHDIITKLCEECEKPEHMVKEMFKKKYLELFKDAKVTDMIPVLMSALLRRELGYTQIQKRKREALEKKLKDMEKSSGLKKKERKKLLDIFKGALKKL